MNSPIFSQLKVPSKLKDPVNLLSLTAILFLVLPGQLYAYIDPGTGSLIIQTLIAAFVGGIFVIKTYWQKIKAWFSDNPAEKEEEQESVEKTENKDE